MANEIDPVSGNEVPFGAEAKNVRDDVPIMASEGEFVIPANVVRFLGLEKIEKMVSKAKEALAAMGEIVDEDDETDGMVEDDSLPFDPSELEGIPLEGEEVIPHLAEGGEVSGGNVRTGFEFPQDSGYSGVKEVKDKDGNVMYVPYMHGQPLFPVPEGYSESDSTQKGDDPESKANKAAQQIVQPLMDNSAGENGKFVEENKSPLAGNPNQWTVDDFVDFGRQRGSVGDKAIKGMIRMMPGGKLAVKAREKWLDRAVSKQFDDMLDTGLDPMGNPITPEQRNQLLSTRENLKKQMSENSGLSISPVETLTNAVQRFTNWAGEGVSSSPRSSLSESGQSMVNTSAQEGYTYSGGNQKMGSDLRRASSDDQYSGSSYSGTGNRDGSASKSAVDNAKSGSGGLYAEGGYVTKRKKKK